MYALANASVRKKLRAHLSCHHTNARTQTSQRFVFAMSANAGKDDRPGLLRRFYFCWRRTTFYALRMLGLKLRADAPQEVPLRYVRGYSHSVLDVFS